MGRDRTYYKRTQKFYVVVAGKETGPEVNADKIKYMVKSRDQNAGRNHNTRSITVPLKGWKSSYIWEQI